MPTGKVSVKADVRVKTETFVLPSVIVSTATPPGTMELGEKLLITVGEPSTVSVALVGDELFPPDVFKAAAAMVLL